MKKTTLQDIADALGISRVSVWKVFSGREGVSNKLKNQIIAKALEMNYSVPPEFHPTESVAPVNSQITISVAVSRPETSTFWLNTIHEIAREAAKSDVNVMYTYLPSSVDESYTLPAVLTNGTVQGIIVLNVYNETLIRKLNALPLAKVFMDTCTNIPFESINGDLLLIEGKSCIAQITEHIIKQGRTKIGFIGDINYAQTNFERYYGFKDCMRGFELPIDPKYCLTTPIGIDTYTEEIENFLDSLDSMPEAFICVSDFVANIVSQALIARGYSIPKDICISGFDCIAEFQNTVPLTTVKVNNHDFGVRLARQILYRIRYQEASRELIYIRSNVLFRESTQI